MYRLALMLVVCLCAAGLLSPAPGAKHVVEIGASTGYSGLWFCLALQATGAKLTTFEIDPGRAATRRATGWALH